MEMTLWLFLALIAVGLCIAGMVTGLTVLYTISLFFSIPSIVGSLADLFL